MCLCVQCCMCACVFELFVCVCSYARECAICAARVLDVGMFVYDAYINFHVVCVCLNECVYVCVCVCFVCVFMCVRVCSSCEHLVCECGCLNV